MEKNVAGKWIVFAFGLPAHANPNQPITGAAANITANIRIDGGAANAIDDLNPTELEGGYYVFDITAVESNGNLLLLAPVSATANVQVIAVPGALYTTPPNFNAFGIAVDGDISGNLDGTVATLTTYTGNTPQTADHTAAIAAVPTTAEFNARTLLAANYFDPATDAVATVTTVSGGATSAAQSTAQSDLDKITGVDGATLATAQTLYAPAKAGDNMGAVTSVTAAVTLPTIPANWITAAGIATSAMNSKGDWNVGKTGYTLSQVFPANFSSLVITAGGAVDSLVQGFLNSLIAEVTAGRISNNFDTFYDNANADTTKVLDDVGAGAGGGTDWTASEKNEIRGQLGITGTTAVGGNTPILALEASVQTRMPTTHISATAGKVDGVATTDAATTVTDGAKASVATEARLSELDQAIPGKMANQVDIIQTDTTTDIPAQISGLNNVAATDIVSAGAITTLAGAVVNVDLVDITTTNTDMRGTNSANTVVPDNTSVAAILVDTGITIPSQITALNNLAATEIVSAGAITTLAGAVVNVDLVDTTTTNTDMVADAPTAGQIADAVLDEIVSGHVVVGSLGAVLQAILDDTNELQADDVPGLIAALNDLTEAQVLTKVNEGLDTAIPELAVGVPPATPSLRTAVILQHMKLRNKLDVQTSGVDSMEVHNDAGTLITQKLITDDGTDYSEAKMS